MRTYSSITDGDNGAALSSARSEDEGLVALRSLAPVHGYPTALKLFYQGASPNDAYFIDQGMVKLIHVGANGHELIVGLRTVGNMLGVSPVILGEAYPVSAITLTSCRLRRIPADVLQQVLAGNSAISRYLLREQCREMFEQVTDLAGLALSARERLERLFARFVSVTNDVDSSKEVSVPLLLKHWEIAQLIAVTPQHLSRLIKKLKEEQIICLEKGRVVTAAASRLARQ